MNFSSVWGSLEGGDVNRPVKTHNLLAPTDIKVKLRKQTFSKRILEAKGGPTFPLQMEEVKGKFRTCAGRILSSEKVEKAIDLVFSLESLEKVDTLTETLNP